MEHGKIYFVGDGTGEALLLTVKGRRVIKSADVVIYDSSVGHEIVYLIPDNAEKIFINDYEAAGHDEIYHIMERHAKQGKCIVCLKGGDTFLFGNDGSYAMSLAGEGIHIEVISGAVPLRYDKNFEWDVKLPLSGYNIIVTKPREMSGELVRKLCMYGAKVLEIPTIRLNLVENDTIVDVVLRHIWDYQWIVFTNQIGVGAFFSHARKRHMDARKFSACKFAVIGPETEKRLLFYGVMADLMPKCYTIKDFGKVLSRKLRSGERILIVGEQAYDKALIRNIERNNEDRNVLIENLAFYKISLKELQDLPAGVDIDAYLKSEKTIVIFSGEAEVYGFAGMFNDVGFEKIKAVCVGGRELKAADALGMQTFELHNEAMADEIVGFVCDMLSKK